CLTWRRISNAPPMTVRSGTTRSSSPTTTRPRSNTTRTWCGSACASCGTPRRPCRRSRVFVSCRRRSISAETCWFPVVEHPPPAARPSVLLRAGSPGGGLDALRGLTLGDAVTADGADYVVEGVATYFDAGQTSRLVHLVPAAAGTAPRWLYIGPAGLEVGLLD